VEPKVRGLLPLAEGQAGERHHREGGGVLLGRALWEQFVRDALASNVLDNKRERNDAYAANNG
jgi:hypothetical protein